MDERLYKTLMRVAVALTVAWVGWTLYDSELNESAPGAHELAAAGRSLEDGNLAEALAAFERAEQVAPENIGILRGRGQTYMRMGIEQAALAHRLSREQKPAESKHHARRSQEYFSRSLALYDEAVGREESQGRERIDRSALGVSYANRGILKDQMGDYRGALADYERAMEMEPEVKEGPGLLTRFLRNQAERPPTVADRAEYLREQLARPEEERLLRVPEKDFSQRAYRMD
jgi:tetratricopeptide (TPR) repeat protein